ncbi:MAG: SDR family NAD(P)-dependent oxidoreductase, partial [Flavobacteriales bacterium]|nr:SDR family NAD(P)-dependent oxidoreductase [Flavobacteriales bacterium]
KELVELCGANDYEVNILVNNAGFGLWGAFGDLPIQGQLEMMNLNMSSLVSLTHYFLPMLSKSKKSHVLNVASVASFLAIPHFSIYAATKAFVLSFSRSLRFDVADQGIKVSCLCPGATESEFLKVAGMESVGKKADGLYMTAEAVAKIGISGMMRGKAEIVPGVINKIAAKGMRVAPRSIVEAIAERFYKGREPG